MGLPRPFKPPKSPTSVAESANAPPVFNKHGDALLHKGHKPDRLGGGSNHNKKVAPSPQNSSLNRASSHDSADNASHGSGGMVSGTSSTDLWLASSQGNQNNTPNKKGLSHSTHSTGKNSVVSYYEEEVLEDSESSGADDFYEEEEIKDNEKEVGPNGELDLFPEHVSTIRFDEYDEMQTVLHINDYTKHEINRSWYKREDYDKMVQLARKTAEKAEQRRKELEEIARQQKTVGGTPHSSMSRRSVQAKSSRRGMMNGHLHSSRRGNSHEDGSHGDHQDDDHEEEHGDEDYKKNGKNGDTTKKPIEYRGLEAWTPSGAAKVKLLKESAIELVWNEQSRQWDAGLFDPDAIRSVYVAVSQTALAAAHERGKSDAAIVGRLKELEALEKEKKKRRRLIGKSKALVKKSVKLTGMGVKQTGKLMQKTTKKSTKLAKEVTKRSMKAGVATATLDPRMMKEALKVSMKKRECKHETIIRPSNARMQEEQETSGTIFFVCLFGPACVLFTLHLLEAF
jgi:hypothetical protein